MVVYLAVVQDPFINTTRGVNGHLTQHRKIACGEGSDAFPFLIFHGKITADVLTPEAVGVSSGVLVEFGEVCKALSLEAPTAQMSLVTIRVLLPVALAFVLLEELLVPMGGGHVDKQGAQHPGCHVR